MSEAALPKVKLVGKNLVGFNTSGKASAGSPDTDDGRPPAAAKIAAVKLGGTKPGLRRGR
jgi:hypothetical protein